MLFSQLNLRTSCCFIIRVRTTVVSGTNSKAVSAATWITNAVNHHFTNVRTVRRDARWKAIWRDTSYWCITGKPSILISICNIPGKLRFFNELAVFCVRSVVIIYLYPPALCYTLCVVIYRYLYTYKHFRYYNQLLHNIKVKYIILFLYSILYIYIIYCI